MSDTIKFTKEELDQITELREGNGTKISEFGQVELEILLANQRMEALEQAKENLRAAYIELQGKETSLVQQLNEKYGAGQVDLISGEFIPTK
jgi:hypothetical protein|tara:strand:- start:4783 stop:5058 length:276 start_codon:yes stop_codon:yes gene_type:complete